VGCRGIFVGDHGCATHIYPVCAWEFSLSLATVHLLQEDVMLMSGAELDYIK
jgi:hypothetical protein